MFWSHLTPGDAGVPESTADPMDPPPHSFAQNQFSCPKFGMLIPQGISDYVKFVSYNYLTYPAQGGLRIMPSRNYIFLICLNPTLNSRVSRKRTVFKIHTN